MCRTHAWRLDVVMTKEGVPRAYCGWDFKQNTLRDGSGDLKFPIESAQLMLFCSVCSRPVSDVG